jgi:hypothetical protein
MAAKTFTLSQLAEGVSRRGLGHDTARMAARWAETGLLEGLSGLNREKMSRLLESQAIELLRGQSSSQILMEANAISTGGASLASSGQIAGFTNVAFPIVRKVFAGLIANEVVSVQPMSLPSGLLFYLDYTYGSNNGGDAGLQLDNSSANETYTRGQSVYNLPTGANIRSGSLASGGHYGLTGGGFSRVHKQALNLIAATDSVGFWSSGSAWTTGTSAVVRSTADFVGYNARFVDYDATVESDLANNVYDYCFVHMSASELVSKIAGCDLGSVEQVAITGLGGTPGGATAWGANYQQGTGVMNLRGKNKRGNWNPITGIFSPDALGGTHVQFTIAISNTGNAPTLGNAIANATTASAVISDALSVNNDGSTLVIPGFETNFAIDPSPRIPEVDIKIESVAVTATTRKLRARWSPEMAQDLTAFYSIDIEAELTNILSEMISLDIDREILNDLLTQAAAANYFWSRAPGRFINKVTGQEGLRNGTLSPGPAFTGDIQQWYQSLMEVISDAANVIHKKTLRGSGNFIITSPDVCTILEHTSAYRASFKMDGEGQVKDGMQIGVEAAGTLNNRYVVYKDPYFPSNKILIGLKGNTFLETGYIYAPYVPLILTPVIYAQEDFTPRKGIMTRYGKKMVRADFYATVTVLDMNII